MNRNEKPIYDEEQLHTLQNNARHRREERNESIKGWFMTILWGGACLIVVCVVIITLFLGVLYIYNLYNDTRNELFNKVIEKWFTVLISAGVGILGKDKLKETFNKS